MIDNKNYNVNLRITTNNFIEYLLLSKNERWLDNLPKFCEYYKNDKEKKEFFVINHFHPLVKEKNERVKCRTYRNYSLIDKYKLIEKGFIFLEEKKDILIDSWTYTYKYLWYLYLDIILHFIEKISILYLIKLFILFYSKFYINTLYFIFI